MSQASPRPLHFLVVAEGDAETADSWSGSSKQIVDHLRLAGNTVSVGNAELTGAWRYIGAAATFSPNRDRWRSNFRISQTAFALRSRRAAHLVDRQAAGVDVVLQIGATFDAGARSRGLPTLVACDSNIRMARDPSAIPYTEAGALSSAEFEAVAAREAGIYLRSAGILTLSERARQSFVGEFGVASDRVTTIYAGPNANLPVTRAANASASRRILFVGRQFERKGGDVLLAAFHEVRRRVPDAELWIAGPDPRGEEPGVRWLGYLSQALPQQRALLAEAFATAAVYCLPTRFEPLGISFIEAMHLALPCVGTNVWAVPEMIIDQETGFVVPVDDPGLLAGRLIELLENPALAARMGEAGHRRANALFTWRHAVERILTVARPLVGA